MQILLGGIGHEALFTLKFKGLISDFTPEDKLIAYKLPSSGGRRKGIRKNYRYEDVTKKCWKPLT